MNKSNISLKSNVYILTTNYPFEDNKFIEKLSDLRALEKMRGFKIGNIQLHRWQHELLNRGMTCSVHVERERPFGVVDRNGERVFECRCSIIKKCPYATRGKCWDIYRG